MVEQSKAKCCETQLEQLHRACGGLWRDVLPTLDGDESSRIFCPPSQHSRKERARQWPPYVRCESQLSGIVAHLAGLEGVSSKDP